MDLCSVATVASIAEPAKGMATTAGGWGARAPHTAWTRRRSKTLHQVEGELKMKAILAYGMTEQSLGAFEAIADCIVMDA
jgi:hypothetical protein